MTSSVSAFSSSISHHRISKLLLKEHQQQTPQKIPELLNLDNKDDLSELGFVG